MSKLFTLRERKNGPIAKDKQGNPYFFTNKMNAKSVRDTLRDHGDNDVVVSYGPDHRNFKGN